MGKNIHCQTNKCFQIKSHNAAWMKRYWTTRRSTHQNGICVNKRFGWTNNSPSLL